MTGAVDAAATLRIVSYPGAEPQAAALSAALNLPVIASGFAPADDAPVAIELHVGTMQLELRVAGAKRGVALDVAELRRRLAQGRRLAVARAVGARPGLRLCDGMAGFGLDGLTLAALGCDVELVESHPVMATLLGDACRRAEFLTGGRARVRHADVADVLAIGNWDAVYLDPMFPESGKRALPKQRMQLLRAITHGAPDDDALARLVKTACARARERVVVKRRRRDPLLPGLAADWCIAGRSVRFDVYRGSG